MNTANLDEIERLLGLATAGEWEADCSGDHHRVVVRKEMWPVAEMWMTGQPQAEREADAALIVALRNNAADLVRAARRVGELEKDARRYLGLRDGYVSPESIFLEVADSGTEHAYAYFSDMLCGRDLDAAIDAAIAAMEVGRE